jgi:hypothetical protein
VAQREKIPTTVASRARLEQATVAYFESLPTEAAREESDVATALDECADEMDFQEASWETDLPTQ